MQKLQGLIRNFWEY